jgi:hypothetical protein
MSDYYDGFGGSQRHHMTDSGASINELLDNKDLRRALFCERELTKNLRLDIQNLDAKRQGAIDSLREHIHLLHKTQSELAQAEQRLKRIDAVQVPDEPEVFWIPIEDGTHPMVDLQDYDTLRDLLKRIVMEELK